MSAAELLLDLGRLGIRLEADGVQLRYFPRSALTPELLDRLKTHKAELVAQLMPLPDDQITIDRALKTTHGQRTNTEEITSVMETSAPARSAKRVCRCGSTTWRDVVLSHYPHNRQSIRRDCARCKRFIVFPVWYGKDTLHNE